jgi:hypothetical protein
LEHAHAPLGSAFIDGRRNRLQGGLRVLETPFLNRDHYLFT